MSQKLLLAEGLDVLRKAEAKEYEVDKNQARISSNGRYRKELSKLLEAYSSIYDEYVRGVEILNHVRRIAKQSGREKGLVEFCNGKILAYMDRCDAVRQKEDNILLPLDQMAVVSKQGYQVEHAVFVVDGATIPITKKEAFTREETLQDGSYLLLIKNLDSYSLAAPKVVVSIDIVPQRGAHTRIEKVIPCQCGWRRFIGIVNSALLKVTVRCDGMVRDSHVDIVLHKLIPAVPSGKGTLTGERSTSQASNNSWIGQLPKISDDDLAILTNSSVPYASLPPLRGPSGHGNGGTAGELTGRSCGFSELEAITVPHVNRRESGPPSTVIKRVSVNPVNATCAERLQTLRTTFDSWPREGVVVAPLGVGEQHVLQAVFAMPIPTEIPE